MHIAICETCFKLLMQLDLNQELVSFSLFNILPAILYFPARTVSRHGATGNAQGMFFFLQIYNPLWQTVYP